MSQAVNPAPVYPALKTPTSLVNLFSTSGYTAASFSAPVNAKQALCGAVTATVLKPVLTLTGAGVLNFFGVYAMDATVRTMRIQIVLDGVTVFDSTSAAIAAPGQGAFPVGVWNQTNTMAYPDEIPFKTSCVINMASSLTETDKFNTFSMYRMA